MKVVDFKEVCKPSSSKFEEGTSASEVALSIERFASQLIQIANTGAQNADSFDNVERSVLAAVRQMAFAAIELYIGLQGDGDLGPKISTDDSRTLHRSDNPVKKTIRSIFGVHDFTEYTYSPGAKRTIELRPISTRMSLPDNQWSYLLQEWSQRLAVDSSYRQAMDNLEAILGSSFSVDTAENINHEMGQMAGEFLLDPPKPKPGSEEKILVASADCKGVPLVKEDAEKVAAFEQRKTNPGNRRMATAASVYSIAPHMRTAEEIADALFREEHDCNTELSERPKPANKNTTAHFPDKMENGDGTEVAFTGIEMAVSWISLKVDARRRKNQRMVVLMDGQEALWNAFSSHTPFDEKTIPILDITHALTYIWAASELSRKTMQAVRYSHVLD